MKYNFNEIEKKWQDFWETNKTFAANIDHTRPKYYVLDFFPYPSSDGLHVGHPEGYTATDIIARYKRMKGFNVLHPMGWDAFGLPAEQFAIKTGIHPRITTQKSIDNFKRQLKSIGLSIDWSREIATVDPKYYKWTQWIFMQLYKKGLAYQAEIAVNWCPELGTVLANEEVPEQIEKGYTVVRRPMKQWMLKITEYAERLLIDLDMLDWPESTKEMQRNWIGKSEGARVTFKIMDPTSDLPEMEDLGGVYSVEVFTTRPDTLWGATYMVLAPEHPLVDKITTAECKTAVDIYKENAKHKSDLERQALEKDKSGVFTGAYAVNPVNDEQIPIWISDYVLMGYGTGAIMAVPGHDERDWEFATKFHIPIIEVVKPAGGETIDVTKDAFASEGISVNSGFISGLKTEKAKKKVIEWLEAKGFGKGTVQYKLRDWLFSRQRFWGEPFPVIHLEDGTVKLLPEDVLPVMLPEVDNYKTIGTGESPLAGISEWVNTTDPETGKPAKRETNTMPQWAGSCWYYLRFLDPSNDKEFVNKEAEKYWMPGLSGLDVARKVKSEKLPVKIVILTIHKDKEYFDEALELDIKAYVLKESIANDLIDCIKRVAAGEYYISSAISGYLVEKNKTAPKQTELDKLTNAEKEILKLISQNKTSAQIADELFRSVRTIENHRNNICNKLGLKGPHALLLYAIQHKSAF